jgi:hypothetical protein
MLHRNKFAALSFRAFSLAFSLSGIVAGIVMSALNDESQFSSPFANLLYYTFQSNILVAALFAALLVKTAAGVSKSKGEVLDCGFWPRFGFVVAIDALLTLVVFWVMLAPPLIAKGGGGYIATFQNLSVHLFTPLLALLDLFLFNPRGKLTKRDPLYSVIFPYSYIVQATILGFSGVVYARNGSEVTHFPYLFMDYYQTGFMVAVYVAALSAVFIGLGYLLYWIDRKAGQT